MRLYEFFVALGFPVWPHDFTVYLHTTHYTVTLPVLRVFPTVRDAGF